MFVKPLLLNAFPHRPDFQTDGRIKMIDFGNQQHGTDSVFFFFNSVLLHQILTPFCV